MQSESTCFSAFVIFIWSRRSHWPPIGRCLHQTQLFLHFIFHHPWKQAPFLFFTHLPSLHLQSRSIFLMSWHLIPINKLFCYDFPESVKMTSLLAFDLQITFLRGNCWRKWRAKDLKNQTIKFDQFKFYSIITCLIPNFIRI